MPRLGKQTVGLLVLFVSQAVAHRLFRRGVGWPCSDSVILLRQPDLEHESHVTVW